MFLLQIEALAGFSAIIDRLGEFSEVVESYASPDQGSARDESGNGSSPSQTIEIVDLPTATERNAADQPLLALQGVTLQIPDGSRTLVDNLNVEVQSLSFSSRPAAGRDLSEERHPPSIWIRTDNVSVVAWILYPSLPKILQQISRATAAGCRKML